MKNLTRLFNLFFVITLIQFPFIAKSQLFINEFLASNTGTIVDPDYKESADWIELYNSSSSAMEIGGYFLTDNLKDAVKWQIPAGTSIPAGGYLVFWADGYNTGLHTSFKISADGEELAIYTDTGTLLDSVSFGAQDANISMGRRTDGSPEWGFFVQPTPGASNDSENYSGIVKSDPSFSISGGIYKNPISLVISSIFGGDVHYTLDGTEPNENSPIANAPVNINKNTVVRAVIHKADQILGPVITNTYLIDTENNIKNLPVVCVSSDPDNFWDPEKGIYVEHSSKPDWEIPVNIELFENDGRVGAAFNLKAGVKSTGLYSWQLPEKMLGISFRKAYGPSKLEYPLIFNKERKVFDTFSLRASGSDWGNTLFRDGMIQSSAVENTTLDNSGFRACVVFINGRYMGIHNIREKIDEDYIVGNHGLESGTFDMIEETDAGHYAETGDFQANDYFLSLIAKDLTNQANYDAVAAVMDIDEFTELVSTEVYSGNSSIGHNLMKWKPKDTGKWKWILMDFDRGFFGVNNQMISFYINEDGWPLKELMKNGDFKKQFGRKLSDLLFTTFNPDRMIPRIEEHQKTIEAEVPNHVKRWENTTGTGNYSRIKAIPSVDYWLSEVEKLKTFAQGRPQVILNDLTNYGFQSPVPVTIATTPMSSGNLTFNGLKIPVDLCNGAYPKGEQIKLTAEAKAGYRFLGWKTNGDSVFIDKEQVWKYADSGADLGTSWKDADFNDADWNSGQAELGYGDEDEKTVVNFGGDSRNKYITTYFRKSFVVNDKQKILGLTLLLKCDDGAVIYLNGNEIQRYNMPAGSIKFGTFASSSVSGSDESVFHTFSVASEFLINGKNTIAVEIHQSDPTSSDISFDMQLTATVVGLGNFISTAKELDMNTLLAVNISAVFESDGKCVLPAEISSIITLSKACSPFVVPENVNITSTGKLIIEPGVEIWMSDGVSISSLGPIEARGTKTEPVIFRSNPESENKKWGNISINNANDTIWFRNVIIENASEGANPVLDIAALAISNSTVILDSIYVENVYKNPVNVYNCQTTFTNSRLHSDMPGVDLINVKRGKILISNCDFAGNTGLDSDCIDFGDLETGSIVRNSYFHDMDGFNSDAVDLGDHSKNVVIDGIVAYNIQDKGVSIGQQSSTTIKNSVFINCGMGAGMKDSSSVNIDHCTYYGNNYAIANYQKHPGDAGAHAVVTNSVLSNSYEAGYMNDEFSALKISNSSDDTEMLPDGNNNLFVNPLFTNPVLYDFSLSAGSPLIGAASDGNIGASLLLPAIPVSVIISDIAYVTEPNMEDLEFIGLYNPGNSPIQLDSCQFTSGITFLFPKGVSLAAKAKLYVTSNAESTFWSGRNATVYQWESGHLDDKGEKIKLVNKFDKIIDQVIYDIAAPWPIPQNSQEGITLNRFDVDNHFGENWQVSTLNLIVEAKEIVGTHSNLRFYPNPTTGIVNISGLKMEETELKIYNINGVLAKSVMVNSNHAQINLSGFKPGIFIVRIGNLAQRLVLLK